MNQQEEEQKVNLDIGLGEKNTLLEAWKDLKNSIFNVLFVILDKSSGEEEEEETMFGLILESGFDYIQMFAFPFDIVILSAWNSGSVLGNITSFFSKFNISNYLPGVSFSTFLILLYSLIALIIVIILDIVYVSYAFSQKKFSFTFPLVFLAQVVPIFVTLFFLPITETLLSVVQCETDAEGLQFMTNFSEIQCWNGWHLFHAVVTLLFVSIFIFISSIVALALFEPRMTSKKLTARQNSYAEVVFIINKIVNQFIFSFTPFDTTSPYVIMIFVLACWQFWAYNLKEPYYKKSASKFFKICSTYYFWTALMLFISQFLSPLGFDGGLIIWISGLPFFAIIIIYESKSDVDRLFASNLKFKSGEEIQSHITYVLQLIQNQNQDNNSYMLLIGYIEKHKEICIEADCPLKIADRANKNKYAVANQMTDYSEALIMQISRMYMMGIKKFPECTKLRMSFAFFHLERTGNKEMAYDEFGLASKHNPSFEQQFNIYRFQKIIKQNLEGSSESHSDLIETIKFENHISLCEEFMMESAKLHKEFWTELKQEIPNLKKLNDFGSQIIEKSNMVKENYHQLIQINNLAFQVLHSYAMYLIFIIEDLTEGKELLKNAQKIYQDKLSLENSETVDESSSSIHKLMSPIVILSASQSSFIIKTFNPMFTELTGFHREELFNEDLKRIMPKVYEKSDHLLDLKQACAKKQKAGANLQEDYIYHKQGYIIPISYTNSYQSTKDEFRLTFQIQPNANSKIILLVNHLGQIMDYSLLGWMCFYDRFAEQNLISQFQKTPTNLLDLGIENFNNLKYQQPQGCPAQIFMNGNAVNCLVHLRELRSEAFPRKQSMNAQERQAQDSDDESMLQTEQKFNAIGYQVVISSIHKKYLQKARRSFRKVSSELIHIQPEVEKKNVQIKVENEAEQIKENIKNLYEGPELLSLYIAGIAQTRIQEYNYSPFELKTRIKTMRLMNNEIKMVNSDLAEGRYEEGIQMNGDDDERELFKFDDENYQSKLRAAINTNLNHKEVLNLKRMSLVFLVVLLSLNIAEAIYQQSFIRSITSYSNEISLKANQHTILTNGLTQSIDRQVTNYTTILASTLNHSIAFSSQAQVNLTLEKQFQSTKNLKDAMILLTSRLIEYFRAPLNTSISSVLWNYLSRLYPVMLIQEDSPEINMLILFGVMGLIGLTTMVMVGYWLYISLIIEKKRFDIMVWFLDIPIPYVMHLSYHCDRYIKDFTPMKHTLTTGISPDSNQHQQYEHTLKPSETESLEIEDQIKVRKSLIKNNKQSSIFSKVTVADLKKLLLIAYALVFSSVILASSLSFGSDFSFLLPQWQATATSIVNINTMYLSFESAEQGLIIPNFNLSSIFDQLQSDFLKIKSQEQFNLMILDFHQVQYYKTYHDAYFQNFCLRAANESGCQQLFSGKMKSGLIGFSTQFSVINKNSSVKTNFTEACSIYVVPALQGMIDSWNGLLSKSGESAISVSLIFLYIFTVTSVVMVLPFWFYYLRKLNLEMNQMIQMLNMIPFKLLPKSRKETKIFILWILKEANKVKHISQ